ncbi:class I SAM-dependent methyltransferase [Kitasatospora sp. NPDC049285]|uniref:class I SAM-dependent DNA methyltransferase n=1 Tax=Kitasatospora sp. NPDC049285 TaxID=3157096 RepID=UPI003441AE3D
MVDFALFDTRNYPMVDVRTGYAQWVDSYERTVQDAMDVEVLAGLTVPAWGEAATAVDLGCGTGRTGAWLRGQGVGAVDGVDLTPEMLDRARQRGAHRRLVEADLGATGLPSASYDLAACSLVDEHLADLAPLYREAFRLLRPGGLLTLVGLHPAFIMAAGMPTHFDGPTGPVAITTHVHLVSDHLTTGLAAGFHLAEIHERVVDDAWLTLKPKWTPHRGHPVSAAYVWRRPQT